MYAKNALANYNRVANLETHPLQQIVMLYNGAIKFLRQAATDIETKDIAAKATHSGRALDIIHYLQSILNFEQGAECARVLDLFYNSLTSMVLKASSSLDASLMRRAADLMVPVCEAWATNARAISVPQNAASVVQNVSKTWEGAV